MYIYIYLYIYIHTYIHTYICIYENKDDSIAHIKNVFFPQISKCFLLKQNLDKFYQVRLPIVIKAVNGVVIDVKSCKVEVHLRVCCNGEFRIFPLL